MTELSLIVLNMSASFHITWNIVLKYTGHIRWKQNVRFYKTHMCGLLMAQFEQYSCNFAFYPNPCSLFSNDCAPMMTSSNGNIFRVTGHLCGEFTGPRWIPRTKASDTELWCFFYLHPNKWLSKQWRGWWFETLPCPLRRHRNALLFRALCTVICLAVQS